MKTIRQKRLKGINLAIIGSSFWGIGGTISDFLFQKRMLILIGI